MVGTGWSEGRSDRSCVNFDGDCCGVDVRSSCLLFVPFSSDDSEFSLDELSEEVFSLFSLFAPANSAPVRAGPIRDEMPNLGNFGLWGASEIDESDAATTDSSV